MTTAAEAAAIVLAAGQSKRFGPDNKLLQEIDGTAIVRRTVESVLEAGIPRPIVVTGDDAADTEAALAGLDVAFVNNATPWAGMGTSLAAGANAVTAEVDGVFIVLGDMPQLSPRTFKALQDAIENDNGHDIAVPVHDGTRGHPVLFGRRYLPELRALNADQGARSILNANPERVRAVHVEDPGTLIDIDTPDDLAGLSR